MSKQRQSGPVRAIDLLRAWRESGEAPPAEWQECLSSLQHAFAPDELAHLTIAAPGEGQPLRLHTAEPALRERLERAAWQAGFDVTGE